MAGARQTKATERPATAQVNGEERTPEEIEREIEDARADLAQTAAAVAEKTDVKGQAKRKADEAKAQAQAKVEQAKVAARENQVQVAAVAAGLAAGIVLIWLLRR